MKTAIGFLEPWRGSIEFEGVDLTRRAPHEVARLGVGFVPENRRIFPGLSVRENLELGLSAARDRSAAIRRKRLDEVFHHFPRLRERIEQPGKTLSGGEQQMLAIARVMMAGARLILMDEPTQGLAPAFIRHIRDMIGELKRLGVTVLLIEQNARVALSVCDRGYIMEEGGIVFGASSRERLDGGVTALAEHRERLVVVNFWATWCEPCTAEMPTLEALWRQYRARGLVVLGVSVDRGAPRALLEPYVARLGLSFPILLDADLSASRAWRVTGLPATFVVRPGGEAVGMALGAREWHSAEMRALLERYLPGAHH